MQKIIFIKLVSLIVVLLLLTGIKKGMVLCFQSTGHVALEVVSYDGHCQPTASEIKNIFPLEAENGVFTTVGCWPCIDIPLSFTGLLKCFFTPHLPSLEWVEKENTSRFIMVYTLITPRTRVILSLPPPHPHSIFYSFRTTVLLV